MISIKIVLDKMEMPKAQPEQEEEKKDICEQIEELSEDMENTETSEESWEKLKKIYKRVSSDKKFPNRDKVLKVLTPVIKRFAQYDNKGVDLDTDHISE